MKRFRLQPLLDDFERALLCHRVALKTALAERDGARTSVQTLQRSMASWQRQLPALPKSGLHNDGACAEIVAAALQEKHRLFERLALRCTEREDACAAAFRQATSLQRLKARRLRA